MKVFDSLRLPRLLSLIQMPRRPASSTSTAGRQEPNQRLTVLLQAANILAVKPTLADGTWFKTLATYQSESQCLSKTVTLLKGPQVTVRLKSPQVQHRCHQHPHPGTILCYFNSPTSLTCIFMSSYHLLDIRNATFNWEQLLELRTAHDLEAKRDNLFNVLARTLRLQPEHAPCFGDNGFHYCKTT